MSEFLGALDVRSAPRIIRPHLMIRGKHYIAQQASQDTTVGIGYLMFGNGWSEDRWDARLDLVSPRLTLNQDFSVTLDQDTQSIHISVDYPNNIDDGDWEIYEIGVFLPDGTMFAYFMHNYPSDYASDGVSYWSIYYYVHNNETISMAFDIPVAELPEESRRALGFLGSTPTPEPEPTPTPEPEISYGKKITDQDYSIVNLAPESIKSSPVSELIQSIDPELRDIGQKYLTPALYCRWQELTSEQLDLFAVGWDLYNYSPTWDDGKKRDVLQSAIFEKSKLGTPHAVKKALSLLDDAGATRLLDWFEQVPPADPYTFVVLTKWADVQDVNFNGQAVYQIKTLIDYTKAARCTYQWYIDSKDYRGGISLKGMMRGAQAVRISNYV